MLQEADVRRSYRYALAFLVGASGMGLLWGAWAPEPEPGPELAPLPVPEHRAEPRPMKIEGIEAVEVPIVGDPGAERRAQLLDEIEQDERERLGPAEAARRRRARQQLIQGRLDHR